MPNCVGISNWDHFLISKKANFVSCAAAPDTIYDKITAVDRAIEQYTIMRVAHTGFLLLVFPRPAISAEYDA